VTVANWVSGITPIVAVLITLIAGWLIGQRVTDRWEQARKWRKLDLSALEELYRCYGEFYAVWKAWNSYSDANHPSDAPSDTPWELLLRAAAAEGSVEALLAKIVTERKLNPKEIDALGSLRQAYRGLRHAIRRGKPLAWSRSANPDYTAFKGLQTLVAELLTRSSEKRPATAEAARNFARVTSNEYEQMFTDIAVKAGVFFPDGHDATALNQPLPTLS
jgi:hypothetical protein